MISYLSPLPERTQKPRSHGFTMVMDKGLSLRQAEDLAAVASNYIDYLKLGFGTGILTPTAVLKDKIKLYQQNGMRPYMGGTLFEAFMVRKDFDGYLRLIQELDLDLAEVSDGSLEMESADKLSYIRDLSKTVEVISEVGSKKADVVFSPDEWVKMMSEELEAGSLYVIAEARESGTTGIFSQDGSVNLELVNRISNEVDLKNILWEAPQKSQQVWFIRAFGSNVNLGNISPAEILPLETLRMGLRGDTFFQFLPADLKPE